MALVHVEGLDLVPQRPEQGQSAKGEQGFLAQPVILVATVQVPCQAAVVYVVLRQVGIEEVDRHVGARDAVDVVNPGGDVDISAAETDTQSHRVALQEALRLPGISRFRLEPLDVEVLAEEALAVEEAYADEWQAEVGSGAQRVARQDTETAAVARHARF